MLVIIEIVSVTGTFVDKDSISMLAIIIQCLKQVKGLNLETKLKQSHSTNGVHNSTIYLARL